MKKNYQKPTSMVYILQMEATLLTNSLEGGNIGGTTGHFDAPHRQSLFDDEEDF